MSPHHTSLKLTPYLSHVVTCLRLVSHESSSAAGWGASGDCCTPSAWHTALALQHRLTKNRLCAGHCSRPRAHGPEPGKSCRLAEELRGHAGGQGWSSPAQPTPVPLTGPLPLGLFQGPPVGEPGSQGFTLQA